MIAKAIAKGIAYLSWRHRVLRFTDYRGRVHQTGWTPKTAETYLPIPILIRTARGIALTFSSAVLPVPLCFPRS